MRAPKFWYRKKSIVAMVLKPLGVVYAFMTARRMKKGKAYQAPVPVICVGNIMVGGTGKTPVCLAVGDYLKQKGIKFFYLNNGYKAKLKNVRVDLKTHTPFDVGDEAILLAHEAPTVVDNRRARGAQLAIKTGAEAIVMDDGFQNPSLVKTFSFVVVDGKKGFGNELVLPAGPLREPVDVGLKRADAIVLVGDDAWGVEFYLQRHQIDLPVLKGKFQMNEGLVRALRGQSVCAFAGIGAPEKFFGALRELGINVAKEMPFPDHYFYTQFDVDEIVRKAGDMPIVTTTKDAVKLTPGMRKKVIVMEGEFVFDKPEELESVLKDVV